MVSIKGKNTLSFSDAYGLSLISSGLPGVDHAAIIRDLSPQARRIGNALIAKSPSKKGRPSTKKAAKTKVAVHR
jgi:hypothetical protein